MLFPSIILWGAAWGAGCSVTAAAASASFGHGNSTSSSEPDCAGIKAVSPDCVSPETAYQRDVFFIGGEYIPYSTTYIRTGQLYVEKLTPVVTPSLSKKSSSNNNNNNNNNNSTKKPYPLLFISAGVPAGNVWLNTPDNRKGWASRFLDEGYQVYLVDITANGRSGQNDLATYPMRLSSDVAIHENDYTAPQLLDAYPQSQGHDRWVGNGTRGDAVFDAFFAAATPLTSNTTAQELSMRRAGCQLLRLIGRPTFVVSHSAGATYASLLSDACPERVRATINLEPGNTPFQNLVGNATVLGVGRTLTRPWGLTNTPITYDPPVRNDSDVGAEVLTVEVGPDMPGNRSCYLQDVDGNPELEGVGRARKLTQIAKVPYVMFTAANSPHITYDHCMYSFLGQAGVEDVTWIQFGRDRGIFGNAHFMYLEANSEELFQVVAEEIGKRN